MVGSLVIRRIHAAFLIVAVAAYATFATNAVDRVGERAGFHAGASQPAICPVTRPSLQLGRQSDGRSGLPLASDFGLPAESPALDPLPGWVCGAWPQVTPAWACAAGFSARITRGPPGFAS